MRQFKCITCGGYFNAKLDHGKDRKYCSRLCFTANAKKEKRIKALNKINGYKKPRYKKSLRGERFERLVVIRWDDCGWLCACDCGNFTNVGTYNLTQGSTRSCGCYNLNRTRMMSQDKDIVKKRAKSLKAHWSTDAGRRTLKKAGDKRSVLMAQGLMKKRDEPPEYYSWMRSKCSQDRFLEGVKKTAKKARGTRLKTARSGRFSTHHKAKFWEVENKSAGIHLSGYNLNKIIRDNEDAFEPEDVIWKRFQCKASRGLRSLFAINKKTGKQPEHWKGWTIK